MGKLKKIKLIIVYKNSVIANGFGALQGKLKIGKVISHNKRAVKVSFKDEDGEYTEHYHITKGTSIDDIGQETGWRISPSDWEKEDISYLPIKSTEKDKKGKTRLSKLHTGKYPIEHIDGNTHELLIDVWKDNDEGGIYLRACREVTKDDTARKKQVPALVPFSVLIKVINEFKLK